MNTTQTYPRITEQVTHWLTLFPAAGQVLFTLSWLVLGFISPGFTIFGTVIKPYSMISAPLSGLGLGLTGPWMNTFFILSGGLVLVGMPGIFYSLPGLTAPERRNSTLIFAFTGIGMMIDGIFTIEYFMPHMAGFLLGTFSPIFGFLYVGRILMRNPALRHLGKALVIASPVTLLLLALSLVTFNQANVMAGAGIAGLTERILCLELAAWFVVLSLKAFQPSQS